MALSVARDVAAKAAAHPFAKRDDPRRAERELGRFAFRWLLSIFQSVGVMTAPGEVYELQELRARLGVIPRYHRYFEALVRKLAGEGLVALEGGRIETTERVAGFALGAVEQEVARFRESFTRRHPGCAGLLGFMASCLGRIGEILAGRIDAADAVFQDGNMDVFGDVFGGDPVSDYFNRLVAEAVRSAAERSRPEKVRVLEIGAGTGGTTAAILEAVEPLSDTVELLFTDISQSFLRYARRRFAARHPWVEYRILDIEGDLARQGLEAQGFDVVVAANVLHDTRDIVHTLEQTAALLKPGGLLVLNEFTAAKDCLFFSGALLHGYWLFEDPERRQEDSCLLSVPQWQSVLEGAGFRVLEAFVLPTQKPDSGCSQSVILAESARPAAAAGPEKAVVIGRCLEDDILSLLGEERSAAYSARRPLMDMGLDSIELVELKTLVRRRFDVQLPPAFLFEHETQEKMARALATVVPDEQVRGLTLPPASPAGLPAAAPPAPRPERAARSAGEGALAVVGMACRFPGGAVTPERFWDLLERGGHGIRPLPPGRWQWPSFVDLNGRHRGIDQGGFLERIDELDARFFRLSPKEAEWMDPQQRLLLELSWEALEDAACRPSELAGGKVGVFIGACQGDYRDVLVAGAEAAEAYVGSGTAYAMLANRISYFHDLRGPSLTVDTACSSSLVALHQAAEAMRRGECEAALVGAVNLMCSPTISVSYFEAGMLSPTGRCHTFDEAADGYVRGEGGAVLVVKPLARALANGDPVYAVVKGTAVNHGGQATTLTAPRPDAQADVVAAAWREAGASLETAGYIEAHGTGTRLGDPIEISGLAEAFRRLGGGVGEEGRCGIGSVKTNLGHLEAAAGLAGLIKILLAVQRGRIPPTLHFRRLNPEIDLGPFRIVEQSESWPRPRDGAGRELPRRAGVSSFGFGGANAHAVVEEHLAAPAAAPQGEGPVLVPLSARTREELLGRVRQLLEVLAPRGSQGGGATGSLDGILGGLADLLRRRCGLDECPPDLEWTDLGWGPPETLLFLSAVEEERGLRLHSRTLIECPTLIALAERLAGEGGGSPVPGAWRPSLTELAYTLQVGREPLAERVAFVAGGMEELVAALRRYAGGAAGVDGIPGCFRGFCEARGGPEPAEAVLARRDLPALAALWVRGAEVDWLRLYPADRRPRRVHLPAYPFSRQRYWVEPRAAGARPPRPAGPAGLLRPEGYRFSSRLTGGEPFVADHLVQGRRVLPAVAYLEMAREAVERAAGPGVALRSFAWLRPLAVEEGPVEVELRLTPDGGELAVEIYSRSPEGGEEVFHAQGRAAAGVLSAPAPLDVEEIRARCPVRRSGEDCYRALAAMGYGYGPAQRGIAELHVGGEEALARLALPELPEEGGAFVLHPALADSAVQATLGFRLEAAGSEPLLPFELRSLEILAPCTSAMWAAVRRTAEQTFDIDLCDETGRVCAAFRGLATRAAGPAAEESLLVPVWEPVEMEAGTLPAGSSAIAGGTERQREALREHLPQALPLALERGDGIEDLRRRIAALGELEHLVWIVPSLPPASASDESLLAAQEEGVIAGFRLVKALLAEGYGDRPLTWTVVTRGAQAVHAGELPDPAHAGVHGFVGSLAKEQAGWSVRLADLPPSGDGPWRELLALPADPYGNAAAWRHGRWYRQQLLPYRAAPAGSAPYRPGAVYVVLGGAGGVGAAWSEALLRRVPAQLVWIGRRPLDASIQARLDRLAELGPRPVYLAADAGDRTQLEAARDAVRRDFGHIDGVVHAAMVLRDQSLAGLTEEGFRAGLAPKVDACVRLAQVFGQEPLDFVLFFSSMLSFLKWPGQSNYVAGCTFKDAFARLLAAGWPCPVRVINWGYWGSVGAASSEAHRSAMASKGFGSIEAERALDVLGRLLSGPAGQWVYVAATDPARALDGAGVRSGEWAAHAGPAAPSCAGVLPGGEEPRPAAEWLRAEREMEGAIAELLAVQSPAGTGALERHGPWLRRTGEELAARGLSRTAAVDGAAAWRAWESRKAAWLRDDDRRAHVELAETALRALPDILAGRVAATDVLFADLFDESSRPLASEVYRRGQVTRLCNEVLAAAVARYVDERRRLDPACRVRILEIGAGTGATSERVLEDLAGPAAPAVRRDGVEEYTFTDLSMAFLALARQSLPLRPDWLRYAVFDVEAPPDEQGLAPGSYDLVLATNVLHATHDIRRTLRHAKALLRTHGLLLLNEIAGNSLFHHVTFGLLDGWWLFEDGELREPGGPALRPEAWKAVLEQEGYRSVVFLAEAMHGAGQQLVAAESDGFVRRRPGRQPAAAQAAPEPVPEPGPVSVPVPGPVAGPLQIAEILAQPRETAVEHLLAHLRVLVGEALSVDPATLDSRSRSFADSLLGEFGMDSLSSNSLRNRLRRDLGVDVAVQRIIAEKVRFIVADLYEQLLLQHVTHAPGEAGEETETFVF